MNFFIMFISKEKKVTNCVLNTFFYGSFFFNLYAFLAFTSSGYPIVFLSVFSKTSVTITFILIYCIPFLFKKASKLRSLMYWVLLVSLTLNNIIYLYFESLYPGIIFIIFIVLYVMDYIFATNTEFVNLNPLKPMPYIWFEKNIYKSLGIIFLFCTIVFIAYCVYVSISLGCQLICLYGSFVNLIYFTYNQFNKKTRRLSFSQGKIFLFIKKFKKHLFDFRVLHFFSLSLIKNFPFFIVALVVASGCLDNFYVYNSYIILVLATTLIVTYPETLKWNKEVFNKKGLRLLGWY